MAEGFAEAVRRERGAGGPSIVPGLEAPSAVPGRSFVDDIRVRRELMQREEAETRASSIVQTGVDPGQLGEPGFRDLLTRADIALSDTFQEKRAKFMARFPEGDFLQVAPPNQPATILFRKNPNEPFAKFDAGLLEAFEPLGDLADLAGEMPSVAAEIFLVRGGGLVRQMSRVFLGEVTGRAAKEVVEEFRGYQRETIGELAGRIATESAIGTAGAGLTIAISGPLNMVRGLRAQVPGAAAAQQAAKELGAPPLLPTQIAMSPLLRKLGQQASATTSTIKQYVAEQMSAVVNALARLRLPDRAKLLRGELVDLHESARRQIIEGARLSDKTMRDGGLAIQAGIGEYDDLSRAIVNKAYQNARKEPFLVFNTKTGETKGIFPDEDAAVKFMKDSDDLALDYGKPSEIINVIQAQPTANVEQLLSKLNEIMDGYKPKFDLTAARTVADDLEFGIRGMTPEGEMVQLDPVNAGLLNIIRDLKALDPSLPQTVTPSGAIIDATEQLRALRSRLWDLKTPNPGEIRRAEHAQAARLYGAVTEVLDNPRNADAAFVQAWQQANALAKRRFETMDQLLVIRASRSETPTLLSARLVQPQQVDNLLVLKEILPPERWAEFQAAARAEMTDARNIDGLTKRLDSFDRPSLDVLFSSAEQQQLRQVGREIDRLNRIGIDKIAERQNQADAMLSDLISRRSTAAIDDLAQMAGPGSKARITLRAALMERVADKSTKVIEGVPTVDHKALRAAIDELVDTKAVQFLTAGDLRTLGNMEKYVEFVPVKADVGGSMQTASTAAGMLQLRLRAILTYMHNLMLGRLLVSKTFQRIVTGSAKKPDYTSLRIMGAVLADSARELSSEVEQ